MRKPGPHQPRRPADTAEAPPSPLAEALASVGDRWKLLLVSALLDGPRRFGDLQDDVPGIAPNILSQRLRQLEQERLVVAQPYSRRPPRFLYELTDAGHDLAGVLRLLSDWGGRHGDTTSAHRHAPCGTTLEARWYCPTCEQLVDEPDADDVYLV